MKLFLLIEKTKPQRDEPMEIKTKDNQTRLLRGSKIDISDNISFYPPTLKDISEIGLEEWLEIINLFFYDLNKIKFSLSDNKAFDDFTPFQIFMFMLSEDDEEIAKTREKLTIALSFLTKTEWTFEKIIFHNGSVPLDEQDWFALRSLVAMEYGIKEEERQEYNLANEKAKAFKEKRKKLEEEVRRIKQKNKEEQNFNDYISAVAAKVPGLNILNVWELTMFQLIDQLNRLNLIDNYEFSLQALLAGADSKKIDVQHWTSKI